MLIVLLWKLICVWVQLVARLIMFVMDVSVLVVYFRNCFDISKRFLKMDRCAVFVHSMRDLLCNSLLLGAGQFSR